MTDIDALVAATLDRLNYPATARTGQVASHLRYHLRRCAADGVRLPSRKAWTRRAVDDTYRAALRDGYANASPLRSMVTEVASKLCPELWPPSDGDTIPHRPPLAPLTAAEINAHLAATAGMIQPTDVAAHRCAILLGVGGGIVGPAASSVYRLRPVATDLTAAFIEAEQRWVIIGEPWSSLLRRAAAERPAGLPLTESYTGPGRLRVARAFRAAVGVEEVHPARLRNTWIVNRLAAGVPIDVLAALTGNSVAAVLPYVTYLQDPPWGDVVAALAHDKAIHPQRRLAELGRLPARPAVAFPPPTSAANDDIPPRDPAAAAIWADGLGAQVTELVADRDHTTRRNLLVAFHQELTWAAARPGVPLDLAHLLRESTITSYASEQIRQGMLPNTVANYKSRLRTLGRLAGAIEEQPKTGRRRDPDPPLNDRAVASLERAIGQLRTKWPRAAAVTEAQLRAALAAGANLDDTENLRAAHVVRTTYGADVTLRGRAIPCAGRHAEQLATLAEASTTAYVTGCVSEITAHHRAHATELIGRSFPQDAARRRWLLDHAKRNVPPAVLKYATSHLYELIRLEGLLPRRTNAELHSWAAASSN